MDQRYPPPHGFSKNARIKTEKQKQSMQKAALRSPEIFWAEQAKELSWFKDFETTYTIGAEHRISWFDGGRINASFNCIDRHLEEKGDKIAIHWQGEPGDRRSITYSQLHQEVCRVANGLKRLGLRQEDIVTLYMPMVPELTFTILACARLGITHNVVFAGFSSEALANRVDELQSKTIVTADGTFRKGKELPLKPIVDLCVKQVDCVEHVIVLSRLGHKNSTQSEKDIRWDELIAGVSDQCPAIELDSEHRLFVLYTSGSTGKPKGIVHSTAGYLLGAYLSSKYIFDLNDHDVFWCTADAAWITGHTYGIYGPLSMGATIVMYDGSPCFPDWNRFFNIIENYQVTEFYTAPTAIRSLIKHDPNEPSNHDLSSLRLLGTVGEPIGPEAWSWYHEKVGGGRCPIVDTWWQTETGSIMISPIPGVSKTKPGSAGSPFFGVDAVILNDDGQAVDDGETGYLVLARPWPSCMRTIFGDHSRYIAQYWTKFPGLYLCGDAAQRDPDGDIWIKGRIDDVINVSGHRLSTSEVEAALISYLPVVEAAAIGVPHPIKGESLCCFISLKEPTKHLSQISEALKQHVSQKIGGFARPDRILFGETLPKTRSGKIMRRLLRSYIADGSLEGDLSSLEVKPSDFIDAPKSHPIEQP